MGAWRSAQALRLLPVELLFQLLLLWMSYWTNQQLRLVCCLMPAASLRTSCQSQYVPHACKVSARLQSHLKAIENRLLKPGLKSISSSMCQFARTLPVGILVFPVQTLLPEAQIECHPDLLQVQLPSPPL